MMSACAQLSLLILYISRRFGFLCPKPECSAYSQHKAYLRNIDVVDGCNLFSFPLFSQCFLRDR